MQATKPKPSGSILTNKVLQLKKLVIVMFQAGTLIFFFLHTKTLSSLIETSYF